MKVMELLSSPKEWTQGAMARTVDGYMVPSDSPAAACWCLMGALRWCYPEGEDYRVVVAKLLVVVKSRGKGGFKEIQNTYLTSFNDSPSTTFEMVREVCEEAGV